MWTDARSALTGTSLVSRPGCASVRETREADVVLVLEGTYPYALGGVSTWVQQLLEGCPDLAFGIVHLYAGQHPGESQFERPANLLWQRDLRLPDRLDAVDPVALAAEVPPARLVHALATGFAGQVGQAMRTRTGAPLLLTEHGIYWYEIEQGAPELECGLRLHGQDLSNGNPCASRTLWVERFQTIARETYAAADLVTTVCDANAELQRALGAVDPLVIPNGAPRPDTLDPLTGAEIATLHPSARRSAEVRIGLVGRVTPIKDIHAFIRAADVVAARIPEAQFYVVGPQDDAAYASSVQDLIRARGLEGQVHLTGAQPVALWHRHLDLVVLTSRSEAEPLALLEAMAQGRPVVAPDIGGCRALIEGGEDTPAGLVVQPPESVSGLPDIAPATAEAMISLAIDPDLRDRLGEAGRRRTANRTAADVARRYGDLYAQLSSAHAA